MVKSGLTTEYLRPVPNGGARILAALFMAWCVAVILPARLTMPGLVPYASVVYVLIGVLSVWKLLRMNTDSLREGLKTYLKQNVVGYSLYYGTPKGAMTGLQSGQWYHLEAVLSDPWMGRDVCINLRIGGWFGISPQTSIRVNGKRWIGWSVSVQPKDLHDDPENPFIMLQDASGCRMRMDVRHALGFVTKGGSFARSRYHLQDEFARIIFLEQEVDSLRYQFKKAKEELVVGTKDRGQILGNYNELRHKYSQMVYLFANAIAVIKHQAGRYTRKAKRDHPEDIKRGMLGWAGRLEGHARVVCPNYRPLTDGPDVKFSAQSSGADTRSAVTGDEAVTKTV